MKHVSIFNGCDPGRIQSLQRIQVGIFGKLGAVVGEGEGVNEPLVPGHGQLGNIVFMQEDSVKQRRCSPVVNANVGQGTQDRFAGSGKTFNVAAELPVDAMTGIDEQNFFISDEYHQCNTIDRGIVDGNGVYAVRPFFMTVITHVVYNNRCVFPVLETAVVNDAGVAYIMAADIAVIFPAVKNSFGRGIAVNVSRNQVVTNMYQISGDLQRHGQGEMRGIQGDRRVDPGDKVFQYLLVGAEALRGQPLQMNVGVDGIAGKAAVFTGAVEGHGTVRMSGHSNGLHCNTAQIENLSVLNVLEFHSIVANHVLFAVVGDKIAFQAEIHHIAVAPDGIKGIGFPWGKIFQRAVCFIE